MPARRQRPGHIGALPRRHIVNQRRRAIRQHLHLRGVGALARDHGECPRRAGDAAGGEGVGASARRRDARAQKMREPRVAAHPREFLSVDARGLGLVRDDAEHLGCDVWGDAAEAGVLERAEGGDGIARVRLDVALHGGEFLSRHRPLRRPILLGETSHVDAPQSIAGGGGHLHLVGIDAAAGTGDIVVAPGGAGVLVKVAVLLRLSPAAPTRRRHGLRAALLAKTSRALVGELTRLIHPLGLGVGVGGAAAATRVAGVAAVASRRDESRGGDDHHLRGCDRGSTR